MDVLIASHRDVRRLLPMDACIEVMAEALAALARGEAVQPLRSATWLPDGARLLGVMPGYLGTPEVLGLKVITLFPGNLGTEFESHQGAVLLFDAANGRLAAVLDAAEITAIRTAAVSAVATRALARDDASDLAILGSGTQARTHLEAIGLVRDLRRVRVWSRSAEACRAFARAADAEACATAREAVEGAEIICTVTGAHEPVLHGQWIAPGAHVNAVGACVARFRELDTPAVAGARLYVDRRESALAEAGDVLMPIAEGAIGEDHIVGELGDVLIGRAAGRASRDERTVFESLGLAVEDLAAAEHVARRARAEAGATLVTVGGLRHEAAGARPA